MLTNGGTALAAFVLLVLIRRGYTRVAAHVTVWGLFALVASLAATNGEPIHVNVVNFSLVIVLATLGGALIVGLFSMLSRLRGAIRERSVRRKLESDNRDLQKRIVALESEKAAAPKPVIYAGVPVAVLKTEEAAKE